jgi:hypothetical protein
MKKVPRDERANDDSTRTTERPLSRRVRETEDPHQALLLVLENVLHRLRVVDKTQAYLIDKVENVPHDLSIVRDERIELDSASRELLLDWHEILTTDDDRPSQASVIVNTFAEPEKSKNSTNPPASLKVQRWIVMITVTLGGIFLGVVEGLKLIGVMK